MTKNRNKIAKSLLKMGGGLQPRLSKTAIVLMVLSTLIMWLVMILLPPSSLR